MQLLREYFTRHKLPFLAAALCVGCEAFCDLLGPTLMAGVINEGIEKGALSGVLFYGARMGLVTLLGACFAVVRCILACRVSQRIGADLRHDLFSKIMRFAESSTDAIESGSLITRMTNDTAQVTQFAGGIMRVFLKAPIVCMGSIVLATMQNVRLSIVIYCVAIVICGIVVLSMKWSYPRYASLQKAVDRMNAVVQEYLGGIRLVKAFGTADTESERFGGANEALYTQGVSAQMIITWAAPVVTLVVGVGTALAILVGSRLFINQRILPGNISAFTIYMAQMLNSLLMITNIFNAFVRTRASTARISEAFACADDFPADETVSTVRHESWTDDVDKAGCGISFDRVTFTYPGGSGVPAIDALSFSVQGGESLAIIGPTGSGKSTICWLLLRFYDVDSGMITLGGRPVRSLPPGTVRSLVAIVPQRPMLFSGAVSENIRWGDPGATASAVRNAADQAQATGFIMAMQDGFESALSSGGVNISGGQKQRISIARGLIKNAPVLILDDATSALDAITEAKVRDALAGLRANRTVVTVTQRCTTAMYSDKILVMENGRSVGFGTHATLLERCETYAAIYRSQVDAGRRADGGQTE
ncbi:MAG: ABC transporter ATP-binding protein/permease [Clostridia bacterium]|nr:ABC transporter ATP-binding protein/permease [Clostridia bacterium]